MRTPSILLAILLLAVSSVRADQSGSRLDACINARTTGMPALPDQAANAAEQWQVTLASGDQYTGVAIEGISGDHVLLSRAGDTTSVDVDAVTEIRRIRSWSLWRTAGYGAMAGGAAGYIVGALVKGKEPASTYLAAGLAGGALVGILIREVLGPKDDIYDLSGMNRLEKEAKITQVTEGK